MYEYEVFLFENYGYFCLKSSLIRVIIYSM